MSKSSPLHHIGHEAFFAERGRERKKTSKCTEYMSSSHGGLCSPFARVLTICRLCIKCSVQSFICSRSDLQT